MKKEVTNFLDDVKKVSEELKGQSSSIEKVISILKNVKDKDHTVFICGNGGSAGTAIHMTADLFKIAGIKTICLNDNIPLVSALTNDEGWSDIYEYQLQRLYEYGDVLITISVHGGTGEDKAGQWSQNLNKAIAYVKLNSGTNIGFSGFDGGQMKNNCDVCIVIPAESTPLVESFHVILHHLITFALQEGNRK